MHLQMAPTPASGHLSRRAGNTEGMLAVAGHRRGGGEMAGMDYWVPLLLETVRWQRGTAATNLRAL